MSIIFIIFGLLWVWNIIDMCKDLKGDIKRTRDD